VIITHEAVDHVEMSGVQSTGEFRIRNSAKAFSILSSGLYSNKIRAIVRELSCNAVDSHTAAGKADTPFELHLPNVLEPWFSVRDYGTGLTHDQVTNIYTTYFESTKTASNEFIGALGLGSKSPFSYTDNFTVTAVKDGIKGIYSAFINEQGVPSIVLMSTEHNATDPNGVEVKFSVAEHDFREFREEAEDVFIYFKLRPTVTGCAEFEVTELEYESRDIVPGVHHVNGYGNECTAVMGNIAYPVNMYNMREKMDSHLLELMSNNLEIHFEIGELDFSASREELSYVPQTIKAFERKMQALNDQLSSVLAAEADAITDKWERLIFLQKKARHGMWGKMVQKYVKDTGFELLTDTGWGVQTVDFTITPEKLAKKYNLSMLAFSKNTYNNSCTDKRPSTQRKAGSKPGVNEYETILKITPSVNANFVFNDTKTGALQRAKYHVRTSPDFALKPENRHEYYYSSDHEVYVFSVVDKSKPAKFAKFMEFLLNPPKQLKASELLQRDRTVVAKDAKSTASVTILKMIERNRSYSETTYVWDNAGSAADVEAKHPGDIHYYLPLSGYTVLNKDGTPSELDVKSLYRYMRESALAVLKHAVYGVRKTDIEFIKTQPNWVNLEDRLTEVMANVKVTDCEHALGDLVDKRKMCKYNKGISSLVTNPDSPYLKITQQFMNVSDSYRNVGGSERAIRRLAKDWAPALPIDQLFEELAVDCKKLYERYPLFSSLHDYNYDKASVAEYINLIDQTKGV
jgi:hypothetical protein